MITSAEISRKIAWIRCEHREKLGTESCTRCRSRYTRIIDDDLGIEPVIATARYFEPDVRIDNITPLTWCQSFDVTKLVLKASRSKDAVPR